MGVKKEDVFATCNALHQSGEKITNTILRSELGDTGSYATISKFFAEWREENEKKSTQQKTVVIPSDVDQAFETMKFQIWGKASDAASADFNTMKAALDYQLKEQKAFTAEAEAFTEKLDFEIADLRAKLEASEAKGQGLALELNDARTTIKVQSQQIITADAVAEKYEKSLTKIGNLEEEIKNISEALLTGQGKISKLNLELDATKAESTRLDKEKAEVNATLHSVNQVLQNEQQRISHLTQELEAVRNKAAQIDREKAEVTANLLSVGHALQNEKERTLHLNQDLEKMTTKLQALEVQHTAVSSEVATAKTTLATKEQEADSNRIQLQKLSAEYAELRGRFSQLQETKTV